MNLTPEQQKERLDAALKLAAIADRSTDDAEELESAISAVEKFRPEPKPIEGWVNEYPLNECREPIFWDSPEDAIRYAGRGATRTAVHMREVVPPDEGLRWRADGRLLKSGGLAFALVGVDDEAEWIAKVHNASLGFGKDGE